MQYKETGWEESLKRYTLLKDRVKDLIDRTTEMAKIYEQVNVEFAQAMYEDDFYEILKKTGKIKDYERMVKLMHSGLHNQVACLENIREIISLVLIKDISNFPKN